MEAKVFELERLRAALEVVYEAFSALTQDVQPMALPEGAQQVKAALANLREIMEELRESSQDFEDKQLRVLQFKSEVARLKRIGRALGRYFRQGTYLLYDAANSIRAERLTLEHIEAFMKVLGYLKKEGWEGRMWRRSTPLFPKAAYQPLPPYQGQLRYFTTNRRHFEPICAALSKKLL